MHWNEVMTPRKLIRWKTTAVTSYPVKWIFGLSKSEWVHSVRDVPKSNGPVADELKGII